MFASLASGFLASFVGNPADLALVRMQNDSNLILSERRNYRNVEIQQLNFLVTN